MTDDGHDPFYAPDERRALERFAEDRTPAPELEERIVGILERRALIEPRRPERLGSRLRALLVPFLKPALVGAALAGAFVLGRAVDRDRPGMIVRIPDVPTLATEHASPDPMGSDAASRGLDEVPRALVMLGDSDRRYEYYVDERGQNYYVLVKLPIPTPIAAPSEEPEVGATSRLATAVPVPGLENSRYEYFYDTHGNAYCVRAKERRSPDLVAKR